MLPGMARGHIQQRGNGTWRVHVYAGRDPVTGTPQYLTGTAKTLREAERLRTKLLHQVDEQRAPNTSATVGFLLDRFLEVADLEMTTRLTYEGYARRTIRPALGSMPARKVTAEVLDRFYAELRRHGAGPCQRCRARLRRGLPALRAGERYRLPGDQPDTPDRIHEPDCVTGRPLAPNSVRKIHFMLRAAFGLAVRWGWLSYNPAELASPPELYQRSPQPPSPEQVAELINTAWREDPDFGMLLWLAMTTGMRRGELCAQRWWHLDLDAGELVIERSYVQRAGQRKEKDTKTHQARRIALDAVTVELLAAHRARAEALAALAGMTVQPSAYVFSPEPGGRTPPVPDSITQRFRRLARRVGVATTLHGFRHYTATQLLAAGVDLRTVAGRLGHGGGGATTLRVYASFVPAPDRRAAELLGGMLPRPGSEPASEAAGNAAATTTAEPGERAVGTNKRDGRVRTGRRAGGGLAAV
jgi:integrase